MESDSSHLAVLAFIGVILLFLFTFFRASAWAVAKSNEEAIQGEGPFVGIAKKILQRQRYYQLAAQSAVFFVLTLLAWNWIGFAYLLPHALFGGGSVLLALVSVFFVSLLLASLLHGISSTCKAFVLSAPERVLTMIAVPLYYCAKVLHPFSWVNERFLDSLLSYFNLRQPEELERVVSPEQLSRIIEDSSEGGELEANEKKLLEGVFTFRDALVSDVMTPRKDIIAVEEEADLPQVIKIFEEHGLSRMAVYGKDLDDIKGILLVKDLVLLLQDRGKPFSLKEFTRPALFVQGSKHVHELLAIFRHKAEHIAIVIDEHGGVDGVVTIEDLLEEIVGEIFDEYDEPSDEVESADRTESGDLLVDGGIGIEELNETFQLNFPTGEYQTFAGFVFHHLGRIPACGETVEYEGLRIKIEEMEQNRIVLLRIFAPKLAKRRVLPTQESSESKPSPDESNKWGGAPPTKLGAGSR